MTDAIAIPKMERTSYPAHDGWVGDVYRPKEQKTALLAFADAIGAKRRLGADEAGNPRLEGRHGGIYVQPSTCDPGKSPVFQIYFTTGHATGWRFAREALGKFAQVTNDADDEGLLIMRRLPSAAEGEVIRDKLVIFKRVVHSEATLAAMRERLVTARARLALPAGEKTSSGGRDGESAGAGVASGRRGGFPSGLSGQ